MAVRPTMLPNILFLSTSRQTLHLILLQDVQQPVHLQPGFVLGHPSACHHIDEARYLVLLQTAWPMAMYSILLYQTYIMLKMIGTLHFSIQAMYDITLQTDIMLMMVGTSARPSLLSE